MGDGCPFLVMKRWKPTILTHAIKIENTEKVYSGTDYRDYKVIKNRDKTISIRLRLLLKNSKKLIQFTRAQPTHLAIILVASGNWAKASAQRTRCNYSVFPARTSGFARKSLNSHFCKRIHVPPICHGQKLGQTIRATRQTHPTMHYYSPKRAHIRLYTVALSTNRLD